MDFKLNEEQQMFHDMVSRFAKAELAPAAIERAASEEYPWDVAAKFAEMGLLGILFDAADGGSGGTLVDAILAIQAVAEACPKSGDVIQAASEVGMRVEAEIFREGSCIDIGTPDNLVQALRHELGAVQVSPANER